MLFLANVNYTVGVFEGMPCSIPPPEHFCKKDALSCILVPFSDLICMAIGISGYILRGGGVPGEGGGFLQRGVSRQPGNPPVHSTDKYTFLRVRPRSTS